MRFIIYTFCLVSYSDKIKFTGFLSETRELVIEIRCGLEIIGPVPSVEDQLAKVREALGFVQEK